MMMKVLLGLFVLLAFTSSSNATYCLCKDGVGNKELQAVLDYACGALADCTEIQPNGVCFKPNTLKSHCDYAVNSYYQRAGQAAGSCYFSNNAMISKKPPSSMAAGCVYPSSPGETRTTTRPPTTPTGTPPTIGSPGGGFVPGFPAGVESNATGLNISYAITIFFSTFVFLLRR